MSRGQRGRNGSCSGSIHDEANVVSFSGGRNGAEARLAELLETARRLQDERASAAGVPALIDATPPEQWPLLATDARLQTNAALERLGDEVRRRMDRNPREALTLAELATTIADALPVNLYPAVTLAQIRAMAWKDRANALRFLGRYEETFHAIGRAEEILEKHVALGLDRAVVDLVKALTLVDTGDFESARAIAMTCGSVFLAHGDMTRALQAGEIEGHILYEQQHYGEAHALFESLLAVTRVVEDKEAEARCHHNLAYCAVHLGNFKSANIHFSEAIAKLTDLGQPLAAVRSQWGAGRVLIGKGQYETGVAYLYAARNSFLGADMSEEAALCALSIAEALLSRGDEESARTMVRDIAAQFRQSPLRRVAQAIVALDDQLPTVETLRSVYAIIESAHAERAVL
jgi:tetratricopeptide (TPR) repeat protein